MPVMCKFYTFYALIYVWGSYTTTAAATAAATATITTSTTTDQEPQLPKAILFQKIHGPVAVAQFRGNLYNSRVIYWVNWEQ